MICNLGRSQFLLWKDQGCTSTCHPNLSRYIHTCGSVSIIPGSYVAHRVGVLMLDSAQAVLTSGQVGPSSSQYFRFSIASLIGPLFLANPDDYGQPLCWNPNNRPLRRIRASADGNVSKEACRPSCLATLDFRISGSIYLITPGSSAIQAWP